MTQKAASQQHGISNEANSPNPTLQRLQHIQIVLFHAGPLKMFQLCLFKIRNFYTTVKCRLLYLWPLWSSDAQCQFQLYIPLLDVPLADGYSSPESKTFSLNQRETQPYLATFKDRFINALQITSDILSCIGSQPFSAHICCSRVKYHYPPATLATQLGGTHSVKVSKHFLLCTFWSAQFMSWHKMSRSKYAH